jgi:hypothetical protein
MEANDTAICLRSVNQSHFSGILALGEATSPSGGSQYGMRMYPFAGFNVVVDSSYFNGSFAVAAISALDTRAQWIGVGAQNPGGINWVLPASPNPNHFINCAGLPAGFTGLP